MGSIIRGCRNALRNAIRTVSVTLILAISIGLALIMLLSYRTVQGRIDSVKSSIGTTVTIMPAGEQGFQGGGNPLTTAQIASVTSLAHVTGSTSTISDRLTSGTDTNLLTSIDAGSLGQRFNRQNQNGEGNALTNTPARTFTLPITATGTNNPLALITGQTKLTVGALFDGSSTASVALVGSGLATKNSLSVGSTFTAYATTITVVGIYDTGTAFSNAGMYLPLATLQTLSGQAGSVTEVTLQVNSIDNVPSVVSAAKTALGTAADITSSQDQATTALAPLENIKSISLYSLIGALVAGSVITLLTMIMIVRERRREIGVLKAIGASNATVVVQFISEALVLTVLGGIVGVVLGALLSNPVLSVLVSSNAATNTATPNAGGRGFGAAARFGQQVGGNLRNAASGLHAAVSPEIIFYGISAALAIAILGSAIPAFLIAKVKPADVMRAE